ncbi:MAG: hypothetical protein J7K64_08685, partial [Bacteroidales bacterium]|nr:hypothetical protein [Bacteroidales bacterium]
MRQFRLNLLRIYTSFYLKTDKIKALCRWHRLLMKALKKFDNNAEFRFIGGDLMKEQGGTL